MTAKLRAFAAMDKVDLFLIESPANHYQPAPPPGWFGLRSSRRRVFMQTLANGSWPHPDEIQRRLRVGEYEEVTL